MITWWPTFSEGSSRPGGCPTRPRPLVEELLGARWKPGADLDREVEKELVARELLQALTHEVPSAVNIAPLVREPCLKERTVGPTESSVPGEPIEAILNTVAHEFAK